MAKLNAHTASMNSSFISPWTKDGIADDIHLYNHKLREWEDYYNYHRPHGALEGQTPYERLLAKINASLLPAS
jgi:transposase InsO family protein